MTDSFLKIINGRPVQTAASGGSTSSEVNYITNFNAETDTTGWSTYADAAAATPVDGTGGSPTVTWTRSTSSPLRGTANFLFTKDAANRQGEGASYAFTIDRADQSKVLSISFDYEIASGTYSGGNDSTNSDLTAYIYDVTNATVIQPAPYKLNGAVSGTQYRFASTFQSASNSTSYRLIIHTTTTSASAYTVKFDKVLVSPQIVINGSPITEWVSYTPTIVGFGTPTAVLFSSRRVGSNLEIRGSFTSGTSTATAATVSLGFNGINGGVAATSGAPLDGSNYNSVGGWTSTGATGGELAMLILANQVALRFGYALVATYASGSPMNGDTVVSTGQVITFHASVPIQGWSSNVQMSSDTDTRIVASKYKTASSQSFSDATTTIVDFDTKEHDTHGTVTTGGSWKFTVSVPGIYVIDARVAMSSASWGTGTQGILYVYKNGSRIAVINNRTTNVTVSMGQSVGGVVTANLVAGDFIDIRFFQNTGGSVTLIGNADHCYVDIHRLSGPSLVAATETVSARYKTSAGQSIPNVTFTIVDFATKDYDTHGAVTTGSSWKFTAPIAGKYQVTAHVQFGSASSFPTATTLDIQMRRNTTTIAEAYDQVVSTVTQAQQLSLNSTVDMLAGQTIDIRLYQDAGGARLLEAVAEENYICIDRIGN